MGDLKLMSWNTLCLETLMLDMNQMIMIMLCLEGDVDKDP